MSVERNVEPRHPGRPWAWFAFVAAAAFVIALVVLIFRNVVTLLLVLLALAIAGAAGWIAVSRRGTVRVVAIVCAVAALAGGAVALIARGAIDELVVFGVAGAVFAFATRRAFQASSRPQPRAVQPSTRAVGSNGRGRRAVLLMNPKSGGGKVEKFALVDEAKKRGIEPILLGPNDDLATLARDAIGSADVIGMAGGDGSQALVAQIALEHDVPYVCVPAGTRNHLALDLGLDRADVVGALDGFTGEVERRIDLAFVNERIFVNNVSLGIYAEIVQSDAYRDAKLETVQKMLPELLGPRATPFDLRFRGPDGGEQRSAQLVLVSNNRYVLDKIGAFGTRPNMDTGRLGIVAVQIDDAAQAATLMSLSALGQVQRFGGWFDWEATEFEVGSGGAVATGIDGEAVMLDPPLRFRIVPAALQVWLPPTAPGLSPAPLRPGLTLPVLQRLWSIAAGQQLSSD
jgi:diacylglycerol kinase family enzyme